MKLEDLLVAYEKSSDDLECLYALVKECRIQSRHHLGWRLGLIGVQKSAQNPALRLAFLFELSVLAFYTDRKRLGLAISNHLILKETSLEKERRQLVCRNMYFYVSRFSLGETEELLPFLKFDNFRYTNPSLVVDPKNQTELLINLRLVNYYFKDNNVWCHYSKHPWSSLHPFQTLNMRARKSLKDGGALVLTRLFFPQDHHLNKVQSKVCGYEDVRLFTFQNQVWFVATNMELDQVYEGNVRIPRMVLGDPDGKVTILKSPNPLICEKNWLPFEDHEGRLLIIYKFHPLTIFQVDLETLQPVPFLVRDQSKDNLSLFRGNTCPVRLEDGGYLCLIHEVYPHSSYIGRNYVHRVVYISKDLYVRHVSEPFKFTDQPVEFANGLAIADGKAYITWGEMDKKAFLTTVPVQELLNFCTQKTPDPLELIQQEVQ